MSYEELLAADKANTIVHTDTSEVERKDDGLRMRYELGRTRRWNIGRRKHVSELDGSVILIYPTGAYHTFWNFDGVRMAVSSWGRPLR